jgi:hypothetical protein
MYEHFTIHKKYFSINDAINAPVNSKCPFIISNERLTKDGNIGRYYTVFPRFEDFLKNRNKYPHCHEILVDHINKIPDKSGRLVFDFDIKPKDGKLTVSNYFKEQVEDIIDTVVKRYFVNVDPNILEYVWSTSENPKKFSKHLTVKNLYFDDWITISRLFYHLFCKVWDEKYVWIESSKLIDFQIIRNRASLRMVGSSKINGYPLVFDISNKYSLSDSLIRIYIEEQKKYEQLVTKNHVNKSFLVQYNNGPGISSLISLQNKQRSTETIMKTQNPEYEMVVYERAYEIYHQICPGIFRMGKIYGKILSLIRKLRKKPVPCLLSGKLHENENAFLFIRKDMKVYTVYFGCYRYCGKKKVIEIGFINIEDLKINICYKHNVKVGIKNKI